MLLMTNLHGCGFHHQQISLAVLSHSQIIREVQEEMELDLRSKLFLHRGGWDSHHQRTELLGYIVYIKIGFKGLQNATNAMGFGTSPTSTGMEGSVVCTKAKVVGFPQDVSKLRKQFNSLKVH